MTGKTHKAGGALCALVGMQVLSRNQLFVKDVSPIIQFLISYPYTLWSCTAVDLDHAWSSVGDKNPVNYAINRILHVFNPILESYDKVVKTTGLLKISKRKYSLIKLLAVKHRSWQTHSDLTLALLFVLLRNVVDANSIFSKVSIYDVKILTICLTGIIIGSISHLILDIITTEGIPSIILTVIKHLYYKIRRKKIKEIEFVNLSIVPKNGKFSVADTYEEIVYKTIKATTYLYATAIIIYEYVDYNYLLSAYKTVTGLFIK